MPESRREEWRGIAADFTGPWFNVWHSKGICYIRIFGEINGGAKWESLLEEIGGAKDIRLVIADCPGGDSGFALAFHGAFHQQITETRIYGLCASAAITMALAGQKILMERNAWILLHAPATFFFGTASEFAREYRSLESVTRETKELLKLRTELTDEMIAAWTTGCDAWLTAEMALAYGLVDEIFDAPKPASETASTPSPAQAAPVPSEKPWTESELASLDVLKAIGDILTHDPARYFRELNVHFFNSVKAIATEKPN